MNYAFTPTYLNFLLTKQNETSVVMGVLLIVAGLAGFALLKMYEKNK